MDIVIENKKWTVIKEYPKKLREKDLLLCIDEYGIRECFQRFEVEGLKMWSRKRRTDSLTEEDILTIEQEVLKETPRDKIITMFSNVAPNKIRVEIARQRKKHGITTYYKADGKSTGQAVLQYDRNMNFIAKHQSAYTASKKTGDSISSIRTVCNGKTRNTTFIWRWADDQ